MSTEQQQIDPSLVEQTKQQIRGLVNEISQLSRSDISVEEFYQELLNRVVSALAAVGGAVWTLGEGGRLELGYQIGMRETGLIESQEAQVRHGRLLRKIMETGEGQLIAPQSGFGEEGEAGNPTDFLLVLGPLKSDQETQGVLEVFQRPVASLPTRRGYLRFLLQMCELAGDFLKTRRLRHYADRQALWSQLENFTRSAHASLDPRETAYTIANEGRRLIECDRVSVALRHGNKFKIEAISGQDIFDKRSNTVQLLNQLATAVGATGDSVWYTGDTSDMPPQVEDAVQEYVDESHSKTVAVLPLRKPRAIVDGNVETGPTEVIGALVVEQIEDSRPREGMLQRVDVVTAHSSAALTNAIEHHSLFLMPVWKQLGKLTWVVKARTLPKTLTVVAVLVAAILALVLVPADFELHGKGTIEARTRQNVFAGVDGIIEEVHVREKDRVEQGQLLARMRSTELAAKIEDIIGRLAATQSNISSKEHLRDTPGLSTVERTRIAGEIEMLRAERSSLQSQLNEYKRQWEQLKITSPIAGIVISWEVLDQLVKRPVQRGDALMEIADPTSELELEVLMPEDRMGHIAKAERRRQERIAELKQLGGSPEELAELEKGLQVTYILSTHPGRQHLGYVRQIEPIAEVKGQEGNTVLLRVAINKEELTDPQLGGAVTAKVYCGRRAIGYVWFHDLIAFVQRLLFRI